MKFRWETEFKETEIGEIPRDWEVKLLGDNSIFRIIMGQSPPSEFYNQNKIGIPFVQGKSEFGEVYVETKTYTKKCHKIAPPNSVLITVRAPVGELNLSKENTCIGRGVASLSFKDHDVLKNKFLYYSLKQLKEQLSMIGERGTTYDSVTIEELIKFPIPFPPIYEQSRIATVLSWFDDLIENKKRQNEILEKVAMAVFKSWFIDFEPFKNGEFVYNEDLGKEIPKKWEVKSIGEILSVIRGVSFNSNIASFEYSDNAIPILRANNVKSNKTLDLTNLMFIPKFKVPEEKKMKELDIVMVGSNGNPELIGNFAFFINSFPADEYSFGSFMYCMRAKYDIIPFIFCTLNSIYFMEYLAAIITGTNISNLKKSDLENFQIILPPPPILQSFNSLVEPIFQKIILNQKQIMLLRKIRDRLLPLLVFGKLRVEEI